jgi:hypothetical protein
MKRKVAALMIVTHAFEWGIIYWCGNQLLFDGVALGTNRKAAAVYLNKHPDIGGQVIREALIAKPSPRDVAKFELAA